MIDLEYFHIVHNNLFWSEKPDCLHIKTLESENDCLGFKLQFYNGHYTHNIKDIACEIRVVSEISGDLHKLAKKEIGIISGLAREPNIVKCF